MPRITVTLDEEQDEWVTEQAEQRDRPKAYVIRDLIESHRTGETDTASTSTDTTSTASSNTDLTNEDVAELHDRVGRLESAFREILEDKGSTAEGLAAHASTSSGSARERRERESEADAESTGDSRNATATDSRPQSESTGRDVEAEPVETFMDALRTNWNENVEERRDVVRAALEWLRDGDVYRATRGDFEDELLPEYAIASQSTDTWWRRTVRPALQAAADVGLVEHRPPGHSDYTYVGDLDDVGAVRLDR